MVWVLVAAVLGTARTPGPQAAHGRLYPQSCTTAQEMSIHGVTAMALAVAVDAANSPMKGRAYAMPLVTSARWSQVELAKSLHIIYSAVLSST